MENFKVLNVIPQQEESCIAVVEVMAFEKIILRYKIVPRKDGSGAFPSVANIKIVENNEERWTPGHMLDSNYEKEELQREIMHAFKGHSQARSAHNTVQPNQPRQQTQSYGTEPQNANTEEPLPF